MKKKTKRISSSGKSKFELKKGQFGIKGGLKGNPKPKKILKK